MVEFLFVFPAQSIFVYTFSSWFLVRFGGIGATVIYGVFDSRVKFVGDFAVCSSFSGICYDF